MRGMIGKLGDEVALEAARAASVGTSSAVSTLSAPLAFAFFASIGMMFLTAGGVIWLAGELGWPEALGIAGGVYLLLAIVIFASNGWRLSSPTIPAAAVAPLVASAQARAAAGPVPGAPVSQAAADMELAMLAASTFRDAAEVGRSLRGPGGRRRRRRNL